MNKSTMERIHMIFAFTLMAGLLLFCGCGIYSFSGSSIPGHIKNVAVPLFQDQTSEFGINQKMTDALIAAITEDNTLKIATPRDSDSIIKGTLLRLEEKAGQYDRQEQASDFQIYLTVEVIFEDRKKRNELWKETWTQWGAFGSSGVTRDQGIEEAIEKITGEILNRMVSGW